jgi:hypothetical protein
MDHNPQYTERVRTKKTKKKHTKDQLVEIIMRHREDAEVRIRRISELKSDLMDARSTSGARSPPTGIRR